MSKYLKLFTAMFLLCSILTFQNVGKALAYQPIDQVNSNGLDGFWRVNTHQMIGQTFTPSKNRLDAIGVKASGDGTAGTLTVYLLDLEKIELITQFNIPLATTERWVYYDFPEDVIIQSVGKLHAIYLTSDNNKAYWTVSLSNTYPRGNAIIDSKYDSTEDFSFVTYGYDYQVPPVDSGDPITDEEGSQIVEQTESNSNGEDAITPASTPSQTLSPPTSVKADDVDNDNGEAIRISWSNSSTSDISGYKIYRSTTKNSGFVSIGTVDKAIFEHIDNTVELGKTYYYYTRSYKDKSESSNSNTVEAKSIDNKAPSAPKSFYLGSKGTKIQNFSWNKNSETDLAGYVFKVYKAGVDTKSTDVKEIKSFDLAKDRDSYALDFSADSVLSIDSKYDYYLAAKDTSGNISEFVKAIDKPAETKAEGVNNPTKTNIYTTENIIYVAGLLLIVALSVFMIIRYKKIKAKKFLELNKS